jgi:hypothetical protein
MVLVFAAFGFGGFVHLGLFLHLLETTSWNQLGEHGNGTCPMYLYNQSIIYIYIYCIPQYICIYIYYIYTVLCIHNIYNRLIIYIYIYLYIYTHIWSIPPPCLTVLRLAQRDAVHGARDDLEILGFTRRFCWIKHGDHMRSSKIIIWVVTGLICWFEGNLRRNDQEQFILSSNTIRYSNLREWKITHLDDFST